MLPQGQGETVACSGYAGGPFSKVSSPSPKTTQGCLLRVQICRVGLSHEVSSSVPARNPDHSIPRRAGNPGSAFRAHPPNARSTAIGEPLECPRLDPAELERALWDDDAHREGAARQALAIPTMARIHGLRRLGDLVADLPALAPAGLRKLHRNPSPQA